MCVAHLVIVVWKVLVLAASSNMLEFLNGLTFSLMLCSFRIISETELCGIPLNYTGFSTVFSPPFSIQVLNLLQRRMVMIYVSCPGLTFSEGHYNSTVESSFGDSRDFVTLQYQQSYIDRR